MVSELVGIIVDSREETIEARSREKERIRFAKEYQQGETRPVVGNFAREVRVCVQTRSKKLCLLSKFGQTASLFGLHGAQRTCFVRPVDLSG